ncbi:unnamed protein product [Penicillium egyptiacum]|uniref:FAD-binding PCMH-type domain-containing protein n=1 Tax=Penicillium egyptiacum TaxID=1303716 RepID=A0A9W4KHI5_9EURO|nr:unnamed protein product [Penicillium egyptiacum]
MKLLLNLSLVGLALGSPDSSRDCRCRPHQSCWPADQEWAALNSSVQGNLQPVQPVAAPCHKGNKEACTAITEQWTNSTWRASQPGAVQWENWEAWPERNESCLLETPQTACGQGRISLYSILAKSASHIQEGVRFAKRHNLRLAIRNSGHDFVGRSTAPDSLQIFTYWMKDIRFSDEFKPAGAPKSEGSAVTIAAGVNLMELYAAVGKEGRAVVAGTSHTVGAAGGYIQGGGHSLLGPWKGMSTDNVLEYRVVTASGNLVTANSYHNSDLFWALRGGGGGTFGVVVSVTLRTFDDAPTTMVNLNISTVARHPGFWEAMTDFHAAIPSLNDAGAGGYYFIIPDMPFNRTLVSTLSILLFFPNQTDIAKTDRLFAPLRSKLNATAGVMAQYTSTLFPSTRQVFSGLFIRGTDSTGKTVILGSRLFSRDLLVSPDGPEHLVNAWKKLEFNPGDTITGHIVAGGAVAKNSETVDSALNPAWRKAVTHMDFARSWAPNATLAQQQAVIRNLTEVDMPILKAVEGCKMGSYMNEANAYEPDFQKEFWGSNYLRLYEIKQKWDPNGLFIARKGVGSEDWDDAGLCRINRK